MRMRASTSTSKHSDAKKAIAGIIERIHGELGQAPTVLVTFATTGYEQSELTTEIHQRLPDAICVGCSMEGVIVPAQSDESAKVMGAMGILLPPDAPSPRAAHTGLSAEPAEAAAHLVEQLALESDKPATIFLFIDSLHPNVAPFLAELNKLVSDEHTILGGAAGDKMELRRAYQYFNGETMSGAVVALSLVGVESRVFLTHGWTPCGLPHVVTGTDGSFVTEIDDRPAWSLFREYLSDPETVFTAETALLASVGTKAGDKLVVQTPLALRDDGAMLFVGGIPKGQQIRLTRRSEETISHDLHLSLDEIEKVLDQHRAAVLHFDCAGRGRILFGTATDAIMLQEIKERFSDVPWLGGHTFGEISREDGRLRYHNCSAVLCAFWMNDGD